jgi:hypothetical protein
MFFSGLNFHEAAAVFFHVVCVGNLWYPEEAESGAIWGQRKVTGINEPGDNQFFSPPTFHTKLGLIKCTAVQLYKSTG